MRDIKIFTAKMESSVKNAYTFFLREARYIGKIELDHARVRQLLAPKT